MKFIDEARIFVKAGDGGRGMVSFRREPYVPRGGPNGGTGGNGGDVIAVADPSLYTLLDFKYQQHHRAENGRPGGTMEKTGRGGESLILRVPVGTLIRNAATGDLLCDLDRAGARFVVARGGRGGRGNQAFATASRKAPDFAQPGLPGEEVKIALELKVLADVGLVGFPNVGKSTLISRVSAARPKIADYPFTTLQPHLGVVRGGDDRSFVVADIPGLIPGAHAGAGLGHRFLRHVERTRLLVHVVSISFEDGREPLDDYEVLQEELRQYDPELAERSRMVVLSMMDLPNVKEREPELRQAFTALGLEFHAISAVTGEGLPALVHAMAARVFE